MSLDDLATQIEADPRATRVSQGFLTFTLDAEELVEDALPELLPNPGPLSVTANCPTGGRSDTAFCPDDIVTLTSPPGGVYLRALSSRFKRTVEDDPQETPRFSRAERDRSTPGS